MSTAPTAAPVRWPYAHRTLAEVWAAEKAAMVQCRACGATVTPGHSICSYDRFPTARPAATW